MLTPNQLLTMLKLQDAMNSKVNPEWLTAGYAYLRAAMVESTEALDPQYKWWKAGGYDMDNIRVEIVDAIHFTLSHAIREFGGNLEATRDAILAELNENNRIVRFDEKDYNIDSLDKEEVFDLIAGLSAARRISWVLIFHTADMFEMPSDDVFKIYVGKNVLNFFRQDHGYKDGTYIKMWDGKEDNVFMKQALDTLDIASETFSDDVYAFLKQNYPG